MTEYARDGAHAYRLTRNFAVLSAITVVIAAALLITIERSRMTAQVREIVAGDNARFIQALTNTLWDNAQGLLARAHARGVRALPSDADYRKLDLAVREYLTGSSVLKVKMFDRNGFTAYSTSADDLGEDYADDPRFLAARDGTPAVRHDFRIDTESLSGPLADRWVLSSFIPGRVSRGAGPITGVIAIYTDITKIRGHLRDAAFWHIAVATAGFLAVFLILLAVVWRAERVIRAQHAENLQLAAGKARAEAASRAKNEFLANMSHELRTPLNAIIGFSEIMSSELRGPIGRPEYRDYAHDITRSGRNLLGFINRVLELVRAENGTILLDIAEVDVSFVVQNALRALAEEAAKSGVTLEAEACESPLVVATDGGRLRDVLLDLVLNGIKFTPRGGKVIVSAKLRAEGDGVDIAVRDTGIGMRADDVPTATALFGQVESVISRTRQGSGLGLPYSRKITEILGGRFTIETAPGTGTTVILSLPWHADAAASDDSPQPLPTAAQ